MDRAPQMTRHVSDLFYGTRYSGAEPVPAKASKKPREKATDGTGRLMYYLPPKDFVWLKATIK